MIFLILMALGLQGGLVGHWILSYTGGVVMTRIVTFGYMELLKTIRNIMKTHDTSSNIMKQHEKPMKQS